MNQQLHLCPMCGAPDGYRLEDGSTFRWWRVICNGCDRSIDECRSDSRTQLGTVLPERWEAADSVWQQAAEYAATLRAQRDRLLAALEEMRRWYGTPRVGDKDKLFTAARFACEEADAAIREAEGEGR